MSLDRCDKSCTLKDLSDRICVPNKAKDVSLKVLIWSQEGINQNISKTFSDCRCKLNGNKMWNKDLIAWSVNVKVKNQ